VEHAIEEKQMLLSHLPQATQTKAEQQAEIVRLSILKDENLSADKLLSPERGATALEPQARRKSCHW
jgi:biopolymer transport protein ExbD